MTQREPGFYWVMTYAANEAVVAELQFESGLPTWWFTGTETALMDEEVEALSARLSPPSPPKDTESSFTHYQDRKYREGQDASPPAELANYMVVGENPLKTARNDLRAMFVGWHRFGPHATNDAPIVGRAILAMDRALSPPPHEMNGCDHKFVDSKSCLKCGWAPPKRATK